MAFCSNMKKTITNLVGDDKVVFDEEHIFQDTTLDMVEPRNTEAGAASVRRRTILGKVIETGFLVTTWLALGLYLEIFGPTLIDLKLKLQSDYESISVAVSGRSYGLFPGCVLGGLLVDKLGGYCHLMIMLCLDTAAIVTAAIPWSPNTTLLWALCFIGGIVESVINIAGQRIILNIWLEKSAAPLHLLHMGYGIGSFILPLYTNPFLAVKRDQTENAMISNITNVTLTSTPSDITTEGVVTHETEYIKESRIEYPYAISAGLVALLSLVFFVYHFKESKYRKPNQTQVSVSDPPKARSFRDMINPATCAGGRFCYGLQILILVFFYFANAGGGERMIANFIRTFSIDQLEFSGDDASFLNTSFWISFTLGRFVFFIVAHWVSIRIIILIETTGVLATVILMNIFATHNVTAYWVLVQPLGFFVAPLWPSGVGWTDHHIELTGMGMMMILLGGSVGGICHLSLIGYLYDNIGSRTFLYQALGYGILAFIVACSLDLLGSRHGSRFSKDETEIVTNESVEKNKDL